MKRSGIKRSTYRTLRSDEPDPPGEPLEYSTSDGRLARRWKIAPRTYVERVVRDEAGNPVRTRPRTAHRIDRDEARRRYEAGESTSQIARVLGCSAGQVSRALRQMGVTMRPPSTPDVEIDPDDVVDRYRAGEGHKAIARDLGASEQRVRSVLVDAGERLRGPGSVKGRGRNGGEVSYETEFQAARIKIRKRSGGRCEAKISERCSGQATHVHHRKLRSQGGTNDLVNLLDVCTWCHSKIHANPTDSYETGLLIHSWADETPIEHAGV